MVPLVKTAHIAARLLLKNISRTARQARAVEQPVQFLAGKMARQVLQR
jgi:hypothetical protein